MRESTVKSLLTYLELDKQTIAIATYEIEQILDVVLNGRIEAKKDVEQLREECRNVAFGMAETVY